MEKPVIAIVGRPNVGKSLLFNRITEKRNAIVEDTPGVTRDRIYGDAEWRNKPFVVVDTGGIEPKTDDEILKFMRQQALIAIDHAQVVVLVTDIRTGVTAADMEVAAMLKKARKPIVLAVNKMDAPGNPPAEFYEFYNLGLATRWAFLPFTATAPATCWMPALTICPRTPGMTCRRTRASRLPSSASPTPVSPAWSTVSPARSGSLSAA